MVEGYKLVSDGPVCMHALASLMPFYNALRVSPPIRCLDPEAYTGGGTVVFEVVTSDRR